MIVGGVIHGIDTFRDLALTGVDLRHDVEKGDFCPHASAGGSDRAGCFTMDAYTGRQPTEWNEE